YLPFLEAVGGQSLAPVPLDLGEHRSGPVDSPLLARLEPLVDALVALDIVAHPAGSVEVDRLERPHEGPAQRQPLANADVDVLDAGIAVGDQAESLVEERPLHAVHDEA